MSYDLALKRLQRLVNITRKWPKLKVYAGGEHPHAAQQPQPFPDYV